MFKKVITLLFGTAFMVVLMLAAGGIYSFPKISWAHTQICMPMYGLPWEGCSA